MFYFSILCIKIIDFEILKVFLCDLGVIVKMNVDVCGYNG